MSEYPAKRPAVRRVYPHRGRVLLVLLRDSPLEIYAKWYARDSDRVVFEFESPDSRFHSLFAVPAGDIAISEISDPKREPGLEAHLPELRKSIERLKRYFYGEVDPEEYAVFNAE